MSRHVDEGPNRESKPPVPRQQTSDQDPVRDRAEGAAPGRHRDAPDSLTHLQRAAGNQAVARMLTGRSLPGGVHARMASAFGRSFGEVRVHTGTEGDRVARDAGALAVAKGEEIFFRSGQFRPETPLGEALLAHELAHVAHRHGQDVGASEGAVEAEANLTTFRALANLHLGASERIPLGAGRGGGMMGKVLPRSCIGTDSTIDAPDFLGPHSLETLESLNRRLGSLDALGPVIAVGTSVTVGFGPPSDPTDTVTSAAEALRALPAIKRAIITQEVTLLLIEHENDMNEQEREFWHRILDSV